MLDNRMVTFLKLCDLMNYRATAAALNMTQPAVTQHIHFLENEYSCKLFQYDGRRLTKTEQGRLLEKYTRSALYNEAEMKQQLLSAQRLTLNLGATKTIGDYVVPGQLIELLKRQPVRLSLLVNNTEHLLGMLDRAEIDLALIEGFFDKSQYGYRLLRNERFVGICSPSHPFSGQEISMKDLFDQTILCREKGSGTREILEQMLGSHNYTLDCFRHRLIISSFELIKTLVLSNLGISFVYEAVAASNKNLGVFTIKDTEIIREFNYVYLKNTSAKNLIDLLETSTPASSTSP